MPPRSEPVEYVCAFCEQPFSSTGNHTPTYCSRSCKEKEYRRKKRLGIHTPRLWRYDEEEDVMG